MFSYEFCEFSKNTLFTEHLRTTAPVNCNNFTIHSAQFGRITYWQKLSQDKKSREAVNKWNLQKRELYASKSQIWKSAVMNCRESKKGCTSWNSQNNFSL